MPEPLLFLGEFVVLGAALAGLHATKRWLGLAPLYLALGLMEALIFVAAEGWTEGVSPVAPLFGVPQVNLFVLFLAALMAGILLVYVLEGTRAAQRLIAAVALLYVLHGAADMLMWFHAPEGPARELFWDFDVRTRAASLGAIVIDFIVLIVVYQLLVTRLRWIPEPVVFWLALIGALAMDGIAFGLMQGRVADPRQIDVLEKVQAGVAMGVPVALYLTRALGAEGRATLLSRRALDIVDLRAHVARIEERLAETRATFGRYVAPEVVEALLDAPGGTNLGGESREVTVLFADIRGYSTLAEKLAPTEVIKLLNAYFEAVSDEILDRRGMINEIEGDGILAVFGAPLRLPDHAARAVDAGRGMLDRVADLNARWLQDGTLARLRALGAEELAIRVGVHSGEAVVGNVGTQTRTKYAVIGDTVNTAARVEGLNKALDTSLLISAATAAQLPPETRGQLVDRGAHAVKGKADPIQVYMPA